MKKQMVLPQLWSNPSSRFQFLKDANDNILNLLPNELFHKDYVQLEGPLSDNHMIGCPDLTKQVLKDHPDIFKKSDTLQLVLSPIVDESIFLSAGDIWHAQHKQMIQVFNWRNIQTFETPIRNVIDDYLAQNAQKLASSQDITTELQDVTFDIIAQILVSDTTNPRLGELRNTFEEYLDRSIRLAPIDFFSLNFKYFPNMRKIRQRKLIKRFLRIGNEIVEDRLKDTSKTYNDFLEHLFTAFEYRQNPTPQKRNEIRDNLVTFIIAGHETTAMTISWALYAAGFHPDAQDNIIREANIPLNERKYTESFVNETMRLFPAAPLTSRTATQDIEVGGINFKKNDQLFMTFLTAQRSHLHWDKPDEFLPERFMNGFKPAPYTFLPFGAGPRICIGMALALMETKIILPAILSKIKINQPIHDPQPRQILTLRSRNGIKLEAKLR